MPARCLGLLGMVFAATVAANAETARVYVSSEAGDRLAAKPEVRFTDKKPPAGPTFEINEAVRFQKIDGFGASFMEAGLMTLNTLPRDQQEEVLRALFDPNAGAGFTAMKTPLAGTDFQSAGPWFSYDDTPGGVELKHFSVARDFAPTGVGTYILRARKYGKFLLQAAMDYPPDWMLYDVRKHQDIPPQYYAVLANYFAKYLGGDRWGDAIFSDLEAGTSAWLYWNPYSSDDGTGTLDQHRFVVGRRLPAMQSSTSGAFFCRPDARLPTFRDKRSKLRRVPNIRLPQ